MPEPENLSGVESANELKDTVSYQGNTSECFKDYDQHKLTDIREAL